LLWELSCKVKLKIYNFNINVDAPPVVSITTQSEEIAKSQSETSKNGQKWKPDEVHLLISCYRRFKHRFDKKNETEKKIWGEIIWLYYFLPVFFADF